MMKLVVILLFTSLTLNAQELSGFVGCGEYLLKGVLVKNKKDREKFGLFIYKTNVRTKSEMQFIIKESEDLTLIASYLDIPTEISAHINKKMNGTRGEINHITKVSLRKNNPLNPIINSGINLILSKDCH